jgi:hypothetical protein
MNLPRPPFATESEKVEILPNPPPHSDSLTINGTVVPNSTVMTFVTPCNTLQHYQFTVPVSSPSVIPEDENNPTIKHIIEQ